MRTKLRRRSFIATSLTTAPLAGSIARTRSSPAITIRPPARKRSRPPPTFHHRAHPVSRSRMPLSSDEVNPSRRSDEEDANAIAAASIDAGAARLHPPSATATAQTNFIPTPTSSQQPARS
jgi:hypothetical protein